MEEGDWKAWVERAGGSFRQSAHPPTSSERLPRPATAVDGWTSTSSWTRLDTQASVATGATTISIRTLGERGRRVAGEAAGPWCSITFY